MSRNRTPADMMAEIHAANRRADAIVARLTSRGWSAARLAIFAGRVRDRLLERGQSGADVWGRVYCATRSAL